MGCEICGRNNCTRSFHSLDEQRAHDDAADQVKGWLKEQIKNAVERLPEHWVAIDGEEVVVVLLPDVLKAIDDAG